MKKKSKFLNYFALSHFIKQKLLMSEKWVETTANKSFALLLKIPIEVAFFLNKELFYLRYLFNLALKTAYIQSSKFILIYNENNII